MNITDWRTNHPLVERTALILREPLITEMLATVKEANNPCVTIPLGTSPDDKAMLLGISIGRRDAIAQLESLGKPLPNKTEPQATYEEQE